MFKLFLLTTLSCFMLTACVAHDPDEVQIEEEPQEVYWRGSDAQQPVRPVVVAAPAQSKTVVVQREAQPSWWQQNKQRHKVKVVVPACPCKDPNDPCPQCYQK